MSKCQTQRKAQRSWGSWANLDSASLDKAQIMSEVNNKILKRGKKNLKNIEITI